ncbi:MAG TPA: M23 family metallopeptidase [Methylomirabilota bacterium]|nr:M23 family metallopeptidase [Methylomirabilota bacterium]
MRGTPADWRRRALRAPAPRPLRSLARGGRILGLLLSLTGCAIEPPHPTAMPSPADAISSPLALVPPPVLSRFGEWRGEGGTRSPARHAGVDIRATTGTPVLAAADGIVLRTGSQIFAGRLIVIGHDTDAVTAYYHLSAVEVAAGQAVRRGDVIGRVGSSGNATAPHLHFGVCRRQGGLCGERIDGGWEDPTRHWIAPNPCFVPGRPYVPRDGRLTYPVPCTPEPAASQPVEGAPAAPPGLTRGTAGLPPS